VLTIDASQLLCRVPDWHSGRAVFLYWQILAILWRGKKQGTSVVLIDQHRAEQDCLSPELGEMIQSAREASDFLKAMSHETRLMILCFLADGERSVSELEEFLSLKQSNVSQHLGRLRLDGLVRPRRDGQTIFYSLASDSVRKMLVTIHEIFCTRAIIVDPKQTP